MLETTAIAETPARSEENPRVHSRTLRTIEARDRDEAVRLLVRGFPHADDSFWRRCLDRQIAVQGRSLGYFLDGNEGPVGLMLMLRSKRRMADGTEREIANLSSWFVDSAHRRHTVKMLRELSADRSVVLTALTAASQVHSMSQAIGAADWSKGMILASAAPFAAMPSRRRTEVLPFRDGRPLLHPDDAAMLDWHVADGCLAAVLIEDGVLHPLIFRSIARRGVRFAQLLFAPSRTTVLRNLPAVTRFLARQSIFFVSIDGDQEMCPRGAYFRAGRPRFWRGPIDRDRLDYAFSELVLFGVS